MLHTYIHIYVYNIYISIIYTYQWSCSFFLFVPFHLDLKFHSQKRRPCLASQTHGVDSASSNPSRLKDAPVFRICSFFLPKVEQKNDLTMVKKVNSFYKQVAFFFWKKWCSFFLANYSWSCWIEKKTSIWLGSLWQRDFVGTNPSEIIRHLPSDFIAWNLVSLATTFGNQVFFLGWQMTQRRSSIFCWKFVGENDVKSWVNFQICRNLVWNNLDKQKYWFLKCRQVFWADRFLVCSQPTS